MLLDWCYKISHEILYTHARPSLYEPVLHKFIRIEIYSNYYVIINNMTKKKLSSNMLVLL